MNKENLLKMADYIETIPQELFNMALYRKGDEFSHSCNSIGCAIGHCTILDSKENIPIIGYYIDFSMWSQNFTGLPVLSIEWDFCFASEWSSFDNTPTGAAKRIRHLVGKGYISHDDLILFNAPEFD